jgi:hypothetical protein
MLPKLIGTAFTSQSQAVTMSTSVMRCSRQGAATPRLPVQRAWVGCGGGSGGTTDRPPSHTHTHRGRSLQTGWLGWQRGKGGHPSTPWATSLHPTTFTHLPLLASGVEGMALGGGGASQYPLGNYPHHTLGGMTERPPSTPRGPFLASGVAGMAAGRRRWDTPRPLGLHLAPSSPLGQ